MQRILLTGAAGAIGSALREGLKGRYASLRLSDRRPIEDLRAGEEFRAAELESLDQVENAMAGMDAVVHLGGKAQEGTWDVVLASNVVGTYNVFEAARRQGVRRVVFASTHHVIGYYRRGRPVGPDDPPRPDSRYAVSKVFGEALGRLYADKYGLGVVCLRIGSFQPRPLNARMLSTWISPRDMVELVRCALEAKDIHFEVAYGVSANARSWWHDASGDRLGFRPRDDAEAFAEDVLRGQEQTAPGRAATAASTGRASMAQSDVMAAMTANPAVEPDTVRPFQGGPLCGMEFAGDASKID